jgi:hypothetical protein
MNEELLEKLHKRRAYFQKHFPRLKGADNRSDVKNLPNTCPSCGYLTLYDRCVWDICVFCGWQDDGLDDIDDRSNEACASTVGDISLNEYRLEHLQEAQTHDNEDLRLLDKLIEEDSTDTTLVLALIAKISPITMEKYNFEK